MLRRQLDTVKLPNQELETSVALKLLDELQTVLMKIADKAVDLSPMLQEFGQELADVDNTCKDGYLRFFDGKSFTYVAIEGTKHGCAESMDRSKDKIQLINGRINYLNIEKFQIFILATQINESIQNDILRLIKASFITGTRAKSIRVAFPFDVDEALQLIGNLNTVFDRSLFKVDSVNKKCFINPQQIGAISIQINSSLETIKSLQTLKLSKSALKILDTRQKYLNGLREFLLTQGHSFN